MSDEKNFPFENTTLEGLSSIKNTNNFTEQFFNQTNKFADEKEFSQAIDNCSEILNFYLLKNGYLFIYFFCFPIKSASFKKICKKSVGLLSSSFRRFRRPNSESFSISGSFPILGNLETA